MRSNLGHVALKMGEREKALACYRQAIRLNLEIGYQLGILDNLEVIVDFAFAAGDLEIATLLLGWSNQTRERLRLAKPGQEQQALAAELALRLGKEHFETLYVRGSQLTLQEAAQIGLDD